MQTRYYKKSSKKDIKKMLRLVSLVLIVSGVIILSYVSLPFISWQLYFGPVFAASMLEAPIPKTTVLSASTVGSLVQNALGTMTGVDYTNAQAWFPTYKSQDASPRVTSFLLSIPKLKVQDAMVSTIDYELANHLVNYGGTSIPPEKGNAVIFGHSTLPQLFNPKDYKTIFANAYTLKVGDEIIAAVSNIIYKYKIYSITVVDPTDISIFSQDFSDSFITLVTCTPPGTIWKRLIIRARLEKL